MPSSQIFRATIFLLGVDRMDDQTVEDLAERARISISAAGSRYGTSRDWGGDSHPKNDLSSPGPLVHDATARTLGLPGGDGAPSSVRRFLVTLRVGGRVGRDRSIDQRRQGKGLAHLNTWALSAIPKIVSACVTPILFGLVSIDWEQESASLKPSPLLTRSPT